VQINLVKELHREMADRRIVINSKCKKKLKKETVNYYFGKYFFGKYVGLGRLTREPRQCRFAIRWIFKYESL
jgi:hypothetical protein